MASVTAALGGSGGTAPALGGAPGGGGGAGTDTTAIHDDTASEISAITNKATVADGDFILIEDSADSNNKKHILASLLTADASSDRVRFVVTHGNATSNSQPVVRIVNGSAGVIGWKMPEDIATIVSGPFITVVGGTNATANIDVSAVFGNPETGEGASEHTVTDSTSTYNLLAGFPYTVLAPAGLTVTIAANDKGGLSILNNSGATMDVYEAYWVVTR